MANWLFVRPCAARRSRSAQNFSACKIELSYLTITSRRYAPLTRWKGSPHTLVCTKNTASYKARLNEYHEDQIHLKTIQAIEASVPS
jgi:hypothetical protein